MAANTSNANEQMFLELINSARLDPLGDAARYISSYGTQAHSGVANIDQALDGFDVNGTLLLQQYNTLNPARPVAWNNKLGVAAEKHSDKMIAKDEQSHQLSGEPFFATRITNEGYNSQGAGENIYAFAKDPLYGHAGFMVDWGNGTGGIQPGAGHRVNIMNPAWREVGIGVVADNSAGTSVGPLVVTQDFSTRGNSGVLILGVAYSDTTGSSSKNDNFYSVGEGKAGLKVAVDSASAVSSSSGGYTLETSATGLKTITLSGAAAGLANPVTFQTNLANGMNIKLDVIDGDTLQTSVSGTIAGSDITKVQGLGLTGLTLTTGDGAQTVTGTKGNDTLSSGAGNDTLNGGSGNDKLDGGSGSDKLAGGAGNDTYVVAQSGDVVTEASNKGTDTVQSSISYELKSNVEKLTLTGSANRNGTGNSGNNTIQGNSGDNVLDGKGGADTVKGGDGNDTLVWDANDVLLDGGANTGIGDTLKVKEGDLDLTTVSDGKIINVERIDLSSAGVNTLKLNMQEVLDLSSTSQTLQVLGDAEDTLNMGAGWTKGVDQDIAGQMYETYTQGSATLLVDTDINVVTV